MAISSFDASSYASQNEPPPAFAPMPLAMPCTTEFAPCQASESPVFSQSHLPALPSAATPSATSAALDATFSIADAARVAHSSTVPLSTSSVTLSMSAWSPPFAAPENASPNVRTASVHLSWSVETSPSPVDEASAIALWKSPPSAVATRIASATISKEIAPSPIRSLSSATLLPVCWAMTVRGLKPWLIIWRRSCPMSLPHDCTCAKTSARPWNFWRSPIAMSPSVFSDGMTVWTSAPKESRSFDALERSSKVRGVDEAKARRSARCALAASIEPRRTLKSLVAFSKRNASRIAEAKTPAKLRTALAAMSRPALTLASCWPTCAANDLTRAAAERTAEAVASFAPMTYSRTLLIRRPPCRPPRRPPCRASRRRRGGRSAP